MSKTRTNPRSPSQPALVEIEWHNAAADAREAEAAARIAVSIAFEQTQPSVLGAPVARPRARLGLTSAMEPEPGLVPSLGSAERPLSYVDLAKHWTWTGFSPAEIVGRREPRRAPLPMADFLRRDNLLRKPVRARRSVGSGEAWRQVNPQMRPGRGGRRPTEQTMIRSAAQELLESLGEPELQSHKGAQIMVWDARAEGAALGVKAGLLDPAGRGMAFARLSGDEVRKGENLGYHVQTALDLARQSKVAVRWVMASVENSGYQWFDERKDLLRLERLMHLGELDSIFVLHLHRMARERLEIEQVCRLLRVGNVDLYICAINRKLDWHTDDGMIASWAMAASQEGKWIKERTHGAIIRRFLLEGRGWPGSIRYGFMRDQDKFLVEDPFQIQIVHWLFDRYLEISEKEGGKGGLRGLAAELEASPFQTRLSHERIRTILMDPIYTTGEWYVTYNDYAIAGKPVELSQPIPANHFQRVQELLSLRGKANSVTPLGHFLLNYVPFFHAPCAGSRSPANKIQRIMLRGELTKTKDDISSITYRHRPHCPDACRGLLVPKAEIEAAVIREVKRLLRTRIFRAAAAAAIHNAGETAESSAGEDDASRKHAAEEHLRNLRQGLARVEQTEAASKRRWLDSVGDGTGGIDDWQEALADIRAERKRLEQRIAFAEQKNTGAARRRQRINQGDREGYLESVEQILTEDTPDDADHRIARAALIKALLSAVVLHHVEPDPTEAAGNGKASSSGSGYRLELHGWLVPDDEAIDDAPDALLRIKGHLDRYAAAGHVGLAEDAMATNDDLGPGGSVKQAEACLTQPEARELTLALSRHERVPAELAKAKVRRGVTISKYVVDPTALTRASFVHVFDLPGPFPQPYVAAKHSQDALVRLGALAPFADISKGGLIAAAHEGRLRATWIGNTRLSSRNWLAEFERSRHPGLSAAGKKPRGKRAAPVDTER